MNLEEDEIAIKTLLICTRGIRKLLEIENGMNENKFALKNIPLNATVTCRLTVDFESDESDFEDLYFRVKDGELLSKLKRSIYQGTSLRSKCYNLATILILTKLYCLKLKNQGALNKFNPK
ncbi:unnamed protein product [Hymenolepis diminuta]|uniref:Uncharacterized protein n=1 Tax=Hymenolepis diminuta TaxID=6216 RepID=A0A564Z9E3_HYMDI|nr:unnamed protein product [Hymenolepis diminuta]